MVLVKSKKNRYCNKIKGNVTASLRPIKVSPQGLSNINWIPLPVDIQCEGMRNVPYELVSNDHHLNGL